jgi:hypothetical protein
MTPEILQNLTTYLQPALETEVEPVVGERAVLISQIDESGSEVVVVLRDYQIEIVAMALLKISKWHEDFADEVGRVY